MVKKNKPTFAYIGSDGAIEVYSDPYFEVTAETALEASMYENQIIQTKEDLTRNFVKLGYYLDEFERKGYYKARGYPTFSTWVRSPEIDISYQQARKLILIKQKIIPLLMKRLGITEEEAIGVTIKAGTSKLTQILQILPLGKEEEAVELVQESPETTLEDVRLKVKAIKMGREVEIDETFPAMFRATVRKGEEYSRIKVDMLNGVTIEEVGTLTIRNIFLPRWLDRFGSLVRIENETT